MLFRSAQLVNLRNAGILSTETVLSELQRGGVLDPDLKISDEISRIKKEEAKAAASQPQPQVAAPIAPVASNTAGKPNTSTKGTVQPTVNPLGKQ